ncbi:rap guanine nucleotide exchange factor 3-like isoform X4 [Mobula hypostoma]|uniref:rap guanine nucleotide exchange factor 3-like isoform X4 n=1 Tax=Mobula hypostoma TaxID=723540 RepID=UPI002FC34722
MEIPWAQKYSLQTPRGSIATVQGIRWSPFLEHPLPQDHGSMQEDVRGKVTQAGLLLQAHLLSANPELMRDRRLHLRSLRRQCCSGREMVDSLLQNNPLVHCRTQAAGVWQLLMEEGLLQSVKSRERFQDRDNHFYQFTQTPARTQEAAGDREEDEEEELNEALSLLTLHGQEAVLTAALRTPPSQRTAEDVEMIFEELTHVKAVLHLSHTVRRQLAAVVHFESYQTSGTVLFSQGEIGTSWYIIWRGSVNVYTHHKGLVSSLEEGDGFGELALVNKAPRSATIVLREDGCQLLRVDKEDFNRILRDVETNTVHLKEHGRDVLVLEKVSRDPSARSSPASQTHTYTVMYGTAERILEYLLDNMVLDSGSSDLSESLVEDFLLSYCVFLPTPDLQDALLKHYGAEEPERKPCSQDRKQRVLLLVARWLEILGHHLRDHPSTLRFLQDLELLVARDRHLNGALSDNSMDQTVTKRSSEMIMNTPQMKLRNSLNWLKSLRNSTDTQCLRADTKILYHVYRPNHSQICLLLPVASSVRDLLSILAGEEEEGSSAGESVLVKLRSTGDQSEMSADERSVYTSLQVNDRLYYGSREQLKALVPAKEQQIPARDASSPLDSLGSRELAVQLTEVDWDLFLCVHEVELIVYGLGLKPEPGTTVSNLQRYLGRFNQIQFWTASELCLCADLGRRAALLKKIIKVAASCKELKNMNTFFALMFGLSNPAVRRLSQTWERLPGKVRRMFHEMERLLDPSRNHRVYRLTVNKLAPPYLPFMPLLLKDMTFIEEGNKSLVHSLVNFEKMRMCAQVARFLRDCRRNYQGPGQKSISDSQLDTPCKRYSTAYAQTLSAKGNLGVPWDLRELKAIDNEQILFQLSRELEP